MKCCITMERTQRLAVFFDADSDDDAVAKAEAIQNKTSAADFEQGSEEYDYALCNVDSGAEIVSWK